MVEIDAPLDAAGVVQDDAYRWLTVGLDVKVAVHLHIASFSPRSRVALAGQRAVPQDALAHFAPYSVTMKRPRSPAHTR